MTKWFFTERQHFLGKHFKFVKTDTLRTTIALQKHHQFLEAPENCIEKCNLDCPSPFGLGNVFIESCLFLVFLLTPSSKFWKLTTQLLLLARILPEMRQRGWVIKTYRRELRSLSNMFKEKLIWTCLWQLITTLCSKWLERILNW